MCQFSRVALRGCNDLQATHLLNWREKCLREEYAAYARGVCVEQHFDCLRHKVTFEERTNRRENAYVFVSTGHPSCRPLTQKDRSRPTSTVRQITSEGVVLKEEQDEFWLAKCVFTFITLGMCAPLSTQYSTRKPTHNKTYRKEESHVVESIYHAVSLLPYDIPNKPP